MTYHTIETTSLTNEADSNLPKEESSHHHKWLGAVATALLLGGGTMLVSSYSSSDTNGGIRSSIPSQPFQSVVHTDIDSGRPWCDGAHPYGKCSGWNDCCATNASTKQVHCEISKTSTGARSPNCNAVCHDC